MKFYHFALLQRPRQKLVALEKLRQGVERGSRSQLKWKWNGVSDLLGILVRQFPGVCSFQALDGLIWPVFDKQDRAKQKQTLRRVRIGEGLKWRVIEEGMRAQTPQPHGGPELRAPPGTRIS